MNTHAQTFSARAALSATLLALLATTAQAQSAAPAEPAAPASPWSATATVTSNYLFKGMTQSWDRPALQGSLDLALPSGWWASLWGSTVSDKVYAGAHTEFDLMGGYRHALNDDWTLAVGLISVFYPGGNYQKIRWAPMPSQRYDFSEANVSLAWRWASLKYSSTLTDLLGFNTGTGFTGGTRGSGYLEANADVPLTDSTTLNLHVGHQNVRADLAAPTPGGSTNPDFTDARVGLTHTLANGWSLNLAAHWNANRAFFDQTSSNLDAADRKNVGSPRLVLGLTLPFAF